MTAQDMCKRSTIKPEWKLNEIELHLKSFLDQCEIWGDLNISVEEYEIIRNLLKKIIKIDARFKTIRILLENYPVALVTDIIGFSTYEYTAEGTWQKWGESLGVELNINHQNELGNLILNIFHQYEFSTDDQGGYKYVTPIQSQAGIPDVCLGKLFTVISADRLLIDASAQEFVDELIAYKEYMIAKPVYRFFKNFSEKAAQLTMQLTEMMKMLGPNPNEVDREYADVADIPARYVVQYIAWTKTSKRRTSRMNVDEQYYRAPKIIFDKLRGVALQLPEQAFVNSYISALQWVVTSREDDIKQIYTSHIYGDDTSRSKELTVPIRPVSEYHIELYDEDDLEKPLISWTIDGLNVEWPLMFFNTGGDLLKNPGISRSGCLVVLDKMSVSIQQKNCIQELLYVDLPSAWHSFEAFHVYPTNLNSSIAFSNGRSILEATSRFDVEISYFNPQTLFGSEVDETTIPVFTAIPTLCVSYPDDYQPTDNQHEWKLQIYHPLSNKRHAITVTGVVSEGSMLMDLKKLFLDQFQLDYGKFEIRLSDSRMKKNLQFYLAPEIQYSETGNTNRLAGLTNDKPGFMFRTDHKVLVQFDDTVICTDCSVESKKWIKVVTNDLNAHIYGRIVVDYQGRMLTLPFKKRVRQLTWTLIKEGSELDVRKGRTTLFPEEQDGYEWRLAVQFNNGGENTPDIRIRLTNLVGEMMYEKNLRLDRQGNCTFSIQALQDTIGHYPLPQRLMLQLSTTGFDEHVTEMIRFDRLIEMKGLGYSAGKGSSFLHWESGGELSKRVIRIWSLTDPEGFESVVQLDGIVEKKTTKGDIRNAVLLADPLPDGVYQYAVKDAFEEDNFFSSSVEMMVPISCRQIFGVNTKIMGQLNDKQDVDSLKEYLQFVIVALLIRKKDIEVEGIIDQIKAYGIVKDIKPYSHLLITIERISNRKSDCDRDTKALAMKIVNAIDCSTLDGHGRIELIRMLLAGAYEREEAIDIIKAYQLYLCDADSCDSLNNTEIKKMWNIDESLALLMAMRSPEVCTDLEIHRIVNHIGYETVESIIHPVASDKCDCEDATECFGKVFRKECGCSRTFDLNSSIYWGDGREYAVLMTEVAKNKLVELRMKEVSSSTYEMMGANYLQFIGGWIAGKEKTGMHLDAGVLETAEIGIGDMWSTHHELLMLPKSRIDGGLESALDHRAFYTSACSSLLWISLPESQKIQLQPHLYPFWKDLMNNFPKMVYRDLVLAEFYRILMKETAQCQ